MLTLVSVPAVAQEDSVNTSTSFDVATSEQAALLRIANEVERLRPLIVEAQKNADPSRRFRVRYDWLLRDLDRIKHGVQDAAAGSTDTLPRDISSLRGGYTN